MKKRRRRKKIKIIPIIIVLLMLIVIAVASFFVLKKFNNKEVEEETPEVVEEYEKTYTTNLVMVGDALIHSGVYNDANRLANYKGYDFKPQITYIKEYVQDFDIAYYNQETILGGTSLGLSNYPRFNSPQEVGDAMIDAGFNLVSLATNHTLDYGWSGVKSSRKYWNTKTNVQAVGSYTSNEEKEEIESRILESNGITYAMLNYTYGTNGISVPSGKPYSVNLWTTESNSDYEAYKATVKKDIEAIRDKVDVLIVAMHWGVEYTHTPTKYEKDMANFLHENGVNIIIGTHPHVIQPVEYIGDTLVFYSLGNFISAQYQNQDSCYNYKCVVGLMSSLSITKTVTNDETTITIDNVKNNLIYTYYKNWRYYQVIPFSNSEIKNKLSNYQKIYNTYAKIIASSDERIETVPLAE